MLKSQKQIQLVNRCGACFDAEELTKAMLWYARNPLQKLKSVSLHGRYPCVSLGKEKIHIHRLLAMYWNHGRLPEGYIVHHVDGNRLNASRENLVIRQRGNHSHMHNAGKKLTSDHKGKLSDANRLRKGCRHSYTRKDVTAEMVYSLKCEGMSYNQISKLLSLDWDQVKLRYDDYLHDNPELMEVIKCTR